MSSVITYIVYNWFLFVVPCSQSAL